MTLNGMLTLAGIALGAPLMVAGALKIARPHHAAASLGRISSSARNAEPSVMASAVRMLGLAEAAVGFGLLTITGVAGIAVGFAAVVLFGGFLAVTRAAMRHGASCGCWGSLTDGPAGSRELQRRGLLTLVAVALTLFRAARVAHSTLSPYLALALSAGCIAIGVTLSRLGEPAPAVRHLAWVSIGVPTKRGPSSVRPLPARRKRILLRELRCDPSVNSVADQMGVTTELDWVRARVTERASTDHPPANLVTVRAHEATIRMVVLGGVAVAVIGETRDSLVIAKGGGTITAEKHVTSPRRSA